MILIGLGANLPSAAGPPRATLEAALAALEAAEVSLLGRSPWYRSAPLPAGDQPWFVNSVAVVRTRLDAPALLAVLHQVEARFGRVRRQRNAPRPLDLDLLDYDGQIRSEPPLLPHPRLHERAFVLLPLRDVAPAWRHPVSGRSVGELIDSLAPGQAVERI